MQWPWAHPPEPVEGARDVHVTVLAGYGLNCEAGTAAGFRMAGARADIVHVADLLDRGGSALHGTHILAFPGGFAFGDHIASGRVLANRLRFRIGDALARHVDDGGLVLGVCNGFQTLVKLGLLPALGRAGGDPIAPQQVSLVDNDRLGYRDAWVRLRIDRESPCVWTQGAALDLFETPSRHGEGKLVWPPEIGEALARDRLIPLRYADARGEPTEIWPDNPNGSPGGAAALCDPTGRVLGVMPHPEAFLYPENHPDFTVARARGGVEMPRAGAGLGLLQSGVRAALSRGRLT